MSLIPYNNTPRFATMFRVAGTKSFRLAAGKIFGEWGANAQNPSKSLLGCLTARKGYSFLQPDQSGAEALIVAHLTQPGRYRDLFKYNIKPHSFLALHIFGPSKPQWFDALPTAMGEFLKNTEPALLKALPGWSVLKDTIAASDSDSDRPYFCGKKTAHARSYCMRWKTFQEAMLKETQGTLVLTKTQAEHFLNTFDSLFPEIIEWQSEVALHARVKGELRNLFGFPRRCEQIFTDGYKRELVSWIPQSTVGCITHEGVLKLRRMREKEPRKYNQWSLLNQKHDSLLVEVPDCDIPDAAPIVTSLMAVDLKGRDGVEFKMKSELQVGKVWSKYDLANNPNGMKEYKV